MAQPDDQPPAYPADVTYQQTYPPPVLAPWPPKARHAGLVVGLVVAAAVLVLVAAAGAVAWFVSDGAAAHLRGPAPFTVTGTLTIEDDCTGWGYDDLHDGTEVTLTDENGKLLAVGQLTRTSTCSFTFTLENVPPGRQFYGITISHRGTLHYSEQQLRQGVELSIGS